MSILYSALEFGLIYGVAALGIYLTLRIIDFPDLTVNGSFVLGAAVSSKMLMSGFGPSAAIFCAIFIGGVAGLFTAFLNLKFKIQNLLAGIIVMIGLYSINMRIMGSPNLVIVNSPTMFSPSYFSPTLSAFLISILVLGALSWFLISELGLAIRATGQNCIIGESYGMSYKLTVAVVMTLSNALVALSGALFSQLNGFADINMGNYTIVIGLASVIIGERLSSTRSIPIILLLCVIGAVIYQFIIAMSLSVRGGTILKTSDIYLITSLLVIVVMATRKRAL